MEIEGIIELKEYLPIVERLNKLYPLLTNDSELLLCKHTMTRDPKEHQENKCRLCGKPYKKQL